MSKVASKGPPVKTFDLEKLSDDYMSGWNSHDPAKVASFFREDGKYESLPTGTVCTGPQAVKDYVESFCRSIPNIKIALKSRFASENKVAAEWTMSGTQSGAFAGIPATNKKFSFPFVTIDEWKEGKISRMTAYYNLVDLLQQLGLMPGNKSK